MDIPKYKTALIVGAGEGLSASLARLFVREGIRVTLAARKVEKLGALCSETGATAFACNASDPDEVERLFGQVEREIGNPDVVVYNASARARGAFVDLVPAEVAHAISVSAFGGFLVAQQAAKRMLPNKHGAILLTGASASVKGYPQSAPFAMGKFALRGMAQSMARELSPQGIHVAHFVIDGGIRSAARQEPADRPDSMLDPDAIALSYWNVLQQPRSAWTWELELRRGSRSFRHPRRASQRVGECPPDDRLREAIQSRGKRLDCFVASLLAMTEETSGGNMTSATIDTGTTELLCEIRDRVAIITLNRPEVRNAMSDNLTPALRTMIKTCGENPEVGALLITGAGTAFCRRQRQGHGRASRSEAAGDVL